MKCPTCVDTNLKQAIIKNVEVDYCAKCKGVWLDKGEIDAIFEGIENLEMQVIDKKKISLLSNILKKLK